MLYMLQNILRFGLAKSGVKTNGTKENSDLVLFKPTNFLEGVVTYSEFYSIDICPKCHCVLDHDKARYKARCCYKCGHSNGGLFNCQKVVVRDVFVDGELRETVVK